MFKTLIGAQAKVLGGEGAGKGWLELWIFEQLPILNEKIELLTKLNPNPISFIDKITGEKEEKSMAWLEWLYKNPEKGKKYITGYC